MQKGRVYIVTNPAFPHLFKIGQTSKDSVEKRRLNGSSVPEDFVTIREYVCDNPCLIENRFHKTYNQFRHYTSTGRQTEFFYICCLNDALEWMDTLRGLSDVTDEAIEEESEQQVNSSEYNPAKSIERIDASRSGLPNQLKIEMAAEFLKNPKTSFRKLETQFLGIESKARGGGFIAKSAINSLGITIERKGALSHKTIEQIKQELS